MTPKITAILATNDDFLIGYGEHLPWKCSPDLKRFKELTTTNDWVVMGYNTYKGLCETWPSKNILPGRKVCVLYSGKQVLIDSIMNLPMTYGKSIERVTGFNLSKLPQEPALSLAIILSLESNRQNVNIIGGSKTFKLFAPIITDIQLTRIITPEGYTPPSPPENPIFLGPEMRTGKPQLEQVFESIKDGLINPISTDEDVKTGVKCEFYHIKV